MTKTKATKRACRRHEGTKARRHEGGTFAHFELGTRNSALSRRGAISTEYMLILALVVLPIAALLPLFISMIQTYGTRVMSLMRLPFP